MIKWMIRGKFNRKLVPAGKSRFYSYKDDQYLYLDSGSFGAMRDGTIYKTLGSAKGKLTIANKRKEEGWHSPIIELEIIKVKITVIK